MADANYFREIGEVFMVYDRVYLAVVQAVDDEDCIDCFWRKAEGVVSCISEYKQRVAGQCASHRREKKGSVKFVRVGLNKNKEE